jgi:hypothetical protein
MVIHLLSCDSLIFIKNYDQNSLNIKLHVIYLQKWMVMYDIIYFLCIQTIIFNFQISVDNNAHVQYI